LIARSSRFALACCALVLASASGCGAASGGSNASHQPGAVEVNGTTKGSYRGAVLPQSYRLPKLALNATNGKSFDLATDLSTPVTVMFFGYTHCPDICQLVMADITSAYLRLDSSVRKNTRVIFVTTDPKRDTVAVLRSYLSRFNVAFVGLTGGLPDIKRAATALHLFVGGVKRLPTGGYDVTHDATVIGFRRERAVVAWTQGTPVEAMASDISTLQRG
jgi:protein SCO1/2